MDFCCGMTMVASLQNVYAEGPVFIHDVPVLTCPTCNRWHIAPAVSSDFAMIAHNCATDGLREANFRELVGEDRVKEVLDMYPPDERVLLDRRYIPDQVDALLDLINLARATGDNTWEEELKTRLKAITDAPIMRAPD
ncbi:hypothetical protein [Kyrpidia tusciae]|uniref:Uncharacterized protein n=1 Tax=Kyrpidia tusciae (strain DSM 2912 / NBRC 15312 / T2) TaxID=562970 RepID=D5WPD3_KYRT2|nr:hypothetical protein [Kyrpidia tusciae]ADG06192.1 hypothetical protein Btus_1479 [Kyrpidia tusciae DSM 2912]MBE3553018.1 hypothetical protein [Kyrpidia tusciae]